eukprot:TRINITY_DN21923_c1_g1_i1.p1 TRINITY_DN21923_c1_g1~~TRINITY_DN21923_c1_g1_i1.p1  ORF type:complete len:743 (+),score=200.47 TRINITY_DN21923_c1_g1_i1:139-2367(+)
MPVPTPGAGAVPPAGAAPDRPQSGAEAAAADRASPDEAARLGAQWVQQGRLIGPAAVGRLLRRLGDLPSGVPPSLLLYAAEQLRLAQGRSPPRPADIAGCLVGLRRTAGHVQGVRQLFSAVASLAATATGPFGAKDWGESWYGLGRQVGCDTGELRAVVASLARATAAAGPCGDDAVLGRQLTAAMNGFRALGDSGEARAGLGALAGRVAEAASLNERAQSGALFGLQRMHCSPEARAALLELASAVERSPSPFTPASVGPAFQGLRRQSDTPETRAALSVLAPKTAALAGALDLESFATALHGLQSFALPDPARDGAPEAPRELRAALGALVAAAAGQGGAAPSSQAVGTALYGMHHFGPLPEVRAVLRVVAAAAAGTPLDAPAVSSAFFGLQRHGDSPELRALLRALARGTAEGPGALSWLQAASALYGMHNVGGTKEARLCAAAIAARLGDAGGCSDRNLATALYGLRQHSPTPESRAVLRLLAAAAEELPRAAPGELPMAFYGMQCQSDAAEVRECLAQLGALCDRSPIAFSAQDLGTALYGLNSTWDSPEVRVALRALTQKAAALSPAAAPSGAAVASCLYGLRSIRGCAASRGLLRALEPLLWAAPQLETQEVGMAFSGLALQGDTPEVRRAVQALTDKLGGGHSWSDPDGLRALYHTLRALRKKAGSPEVQHLLGEVVHEVTGAEQASSGVWLELEKGVRKLRLFLPREGDGSQSTALPGPRIWQRRLRPWAAER